MDDLHVAVVERQLAALNVAEALDFVSDPRFGGIAVFVGKVREFNLGRQVTGISYDLFEPLALRTFRAIGERAQHELGAPLKLYIAHAKGHLSLGDVAVVVAAGTPHRAEAFQACRLAIEAVKHEAPIWKQEHYIDGDSAWSEGCSLCQPESDATAHDATGEDGNAVHGHHH
ncbi:molybdenum cofactor biosynthesis protein MoaE [Dyella sp. ASV21]|uniref:molybdenum cofactor biosynthesis protein MoaE n=1 Tax=Dyella sp. ASV21 TaxID=2795114 RepID=UPI0018EAA1CB|nr:molybdenum cofactor biosynthesis protein MoaE [Dyella sp. ASV21]